MELYNECILFYERIVFIMNVSCSLGLGAAFAAPNHTFINPKREGGYLGRKNSRVGY